MNAQGVDEPELRIDQLRDDALATWFCQASPGVTYVRCSQPAKYLPGQVLDLDESDVAEDRDGEVYFTRAKGTHIWSFSGNNTRAVLMAGAQTLGHKVWMEVDDNYQMHPDAPETSKWQKKYRGKDESSYEVVGWISEFVDGVIVSTPTLGDVYSQFNDNIHVCRNCVDPEDWDELDKPDDGILRIGWAASDSHRRDAPLLKQAFRWLYGREGVEIIIIGIQNASFPVPVTYIPWMNSHRAYRKVLQTLDVMLCPVIRTPWADCKSDLKCLEAGMVGAMSVVSDSPAFDLWHDRTYTCKTEQDWERAVKSLYRNRDEVKQLQKEHREYVLSERTIQKGISQWHKALGITSSSKTQTSTSSKSETASIVMS